MSLFKPATKAKAKLRLAIDGPAGAGKTFTALLLAQELGKKVCLIDTERGSASLYADKFKFDVYEPDTHHPQKYIDGIREAGKAGYDVIVIDSLSHAWMGKDGALELVDKAAKRSQSQNSYTAWRDVTPLHNELVDTILTAPAHVIFTMRTKMEYVLEENGKGKKVPVKKGMAPIQREGVEFEATVVCDMDVDHNLIVSKSRISSIDGLVLNKPDAEFAQYLIHWLNDGVEPESPKSTPAAPANKSASEKQSTPAPSANSGASADTAKVKSDTAPSTGNTGTTTGGTAGDPKSAKTAEPNLSQSEQKQSDASAAPLTQATKQASQTEGSANQTDPAISVEKNATASSSAPTESKSGAVSATQPTSGPSELADQVIINKIYALAQSKGYSSIDVQRHATWQHNKHMEEITVPEARLIYAHYMKLEAKAS